MNIITLGVGSSAGTPMVGCECAVCLSSDGRNQRTRASVVVQVQGVHLLIDTGPDLRAQALREKLQQVDAVLYTHCHADHLNGIDDLRAFCYRQKQVLPVYGHHHTMTDIEQRFPYALLPPGLYWDKPVLATHRVDDRFTVGGVPVQPLPVMHGTWLIYGYRIGSFAYITDVSEIPESTFDLLQGLEVLFLDCLRERPHPTHFSVEQALAAAERIAARQTYFIHMTHELEFNALQARLPAGMSVAYDSLRFSLPDPSF